ncbi:MAG TPA: NAD(P)/FAD-dependent oxidoreductase [Thermodesulfobacteriota bacterium]|nr:NAD(P)/FAD-dependent oxidoreductase [Thermodesulfobacteriota bacterium]
MSRMLKYESEIRDQALYDTSIKNEESSEKPKVVIIGAGPAGLTAAYELHKAGIGSIVLEKDNIVGGIARTVSYKGYLFDIGGHRFFTKVGAVEDMWHEVLGEDFLRRGRLSRIYYNKKFFYYPLRASNALLGLGVWNSFRILLSYLKAQGFPEMPEETFEQWVSNRFGKRLYSVFFKTYTEKVWGIPCSEIRAEWAAQRIKGLSLLSALRNALLKQQNSDNNGAVIKTLIDSFYYPKLGPGMLWEKVTDVVTRNGCNVRLGTGVEKILWANNKVNAVEIKIDEGIELISGSHFISTMPIRELVQKLEPAPPEEVLKAAASLNYRDFLTVVLIVNKRDVFPDNWIYIHDSDVKVGRIQNFKNWSPYMVPDQDKTCLGLEYFCFEGDGLWTRSDQELVELGKKELEISGLGSASDVEDGTVVRMPKAYPVYDSTYQESLQIIRNFLSRIDNLQLTGRNGMHKYNNQDHSMLTAMLAVKNILGSSHNLWQVNADQEYHEEVRESEKKVYKEYEPIASTQPLVPERIFQPQEAALRQALTRTFARIDKFAFATAVGLVCSLAVFIVTLWLVLKGGEVVGPNLQLLGQYFIGYTVTVKGAFIGTIYSFLWSFILGWLFAYLRNLSISLFLYRAKRKTESLSYRNLLDYV